MKTNKRENEQKANRKSDKRTAEKLKENRVRKDKMNDNDDIEDDALQYGSQVAIMSIGAILGIITILALSVFIFFKDLIF